MKVADELAFGFVEFYLRNVLHRHGNALILSHWSRTVVREYGWCGWLAG